MPAVASRAPALVRFDQRRRRCAQLRTCTPFAAQWLELYGALLDVQQDACVAALAARPAEPLLADYVAAHVAGAVVAVTARHGPPLLADAALARAGGIGPLVLRWLHGEILPPVENYLARAAAAPVLEAVAAEGGFAVAGTVADGTAQCPRCGGLPQVAFTERSSEALVTGPRRLVCARCASLWSVERLRCPACGEGASAQLRLCSDGSCLQHLRAITCDTCRSYLVDVDLRADADAVAEVDELVATPLDLELQARGYGKLVPNLIGN